MKKCVVFIEGGYTQLMLPNGDVLPLETEGVLKTSILGEDGRREKTATYTATFHVDVKSTREEAKEHLELQETNSLRDTTVYVP